MWKAKGRVYPDGDIECSVYLNRSIESRKRLVKLKRVEREKRDKENRERSIRRARAQLRRKVKCAGLNVKFELTYRENVEHRERVLGDWDNFRRLMKERRGSFAYIMVLERQERGAYHIHVLTDKQIPHAKLWKLWCEASGQEYEHEGYCWIEQVNIKWAVGYVSKYLGKAFDDSERCPGQKLYTCSKGLLFELVEFSHDVGDKADAVSLLFGLCGKEGYFWLDELHSKGIGYANNW